MYDIRGMGQVDPPSVGMYCPCTAGTQHSAALRRPSRCIWHPPRTAHLMNSRIFRWCGTASQMDTLADIGVCGCRGTSRRGRGRLLPCLQWCQRCLQDKACTLLVSLVLCTTHSCTAHTSCPAVWRKDRAVRCCGGRSCTLPCPAGSCWLGTRATHSCWWHCCKFGPEGTGRTPTSPSLNR